MPSTSWTTAHRSEVRLPGVPAVQPRYLRHLFTAEEMLGMRLAVMHNLYFYNKLTERIRDSLDNGYI